MAVDYEEYKLDWDKWGVIGRPSISVDVMLEAMEEAIPDVEYGRTEIVIAAERLYIEPFNVMDAFSRLRKDDPRYLRYEKMLRGEGHLLEPRKTSHRVKNWHSDRYAVAYMKDGEEHWVQTEFNQSETERIAAMFNEYYSSLGCQEYEYYAVEIVDGY